MSPRRTSKPTTPAPHHRRQKEVAPPAAAPTKEPGQIALELRGLAALLGALVERGNHGVVFMDPNVVFFVTAVLVGAAAELER